VTELRSDAPLADPPPLPTPRYDWQAIAAKARKTPGRWRIVFTQDRQSLRVAIRAGDIAALKPSKGFVTTTRNNRRPEGGPRLCDLYVKYVPELDEERRK
jgi:hypothetical protein